MGKYSAWIDELARKLVAEVFALVGDPAVQFGYPPLACSRRQLPRFLRARSHGAAASLAWAFGLTPFTGGAYMDVGILPRRPHSDHHPK